MRKPAFNVGLDPAEHITGNVVPLQKRIERLEAALQDIMTRTAPYKDDESWPLVSGVHNVAEAAMRRDPDR